MLSRKSAPNLRQDASSAIPCYCPGKVGNDADEVWAALTRDRR